MDFATTMHSCFTEKYATFSGRATRSEYCWLTMVIAGGLMFLEDYLLGAVVIMAVVTFCPHWAAGFRRLQDTGLSGWLSLIPLGIVVVHPFLPQVPYSTVVVLQRFVLPDITTLEPYALLISFEMLTLLLFVWLLLRPSQPTTNAYGPPPQSAT